MTEAKKTGRDQAPEQPAGEMPAMRETDRLPGRRDGLPPGGLSRPFFGPQGDEHRDPPQGAPMPAPGLGKDAPDIPPPRRSRR